MSCLPDRSRFAVILSPLAIVAALVGPAAAEPVVGLGVSFAIGGGSPEVGIGLRLFSDNRPQSAAASLGVDYMFSSRRIRPTVGVAFLSSNVYVGLDLGYDFNNGRLDYGVGAGATRTVAPAPPPAVAAAPPS